MMLNPDRCCNVEFLDDSAFRWRCNVYLFQFVFGAQESANWNVALALIANCVG